MERSLLLLLLFCAASVNAQWQSVGGGVDNFVRTLSLSEDSSELIVSGAFIYTRSDSLRANGLASWDGTNWDTSSFAGGNGDTSANGMLQSFLSVVPYHDTLFTSFTWHFDPMLDDIGYLANGQWHPCGNANVLFWFLQENDRLFGGGLSDTTPAGVVMHGVNEWVNGQWHRPKGSPFNMLAQPVTMTYWKDQYIFGGVFNVLGSGKVVAYDGDSTWSPLGSGVGGTWLYTLGSYGDSLYAGGFLTNNGLSDHVVIWDGNDWLPFFSEVQFISRVFSIKEFDGSLYISGIYHFTGDTTLYGILRYDGTSLCALGGNMTGDNGRIEFFQGDLYIALANTYLPLYGQRIARLDLDSVVPDHCIQVTQTHVSEMQADRQVLIHPNPAHTAITINCPNCTRATQVSVFNVLGEQTLSGTVAPSQMSIAVDQLQPGTYVVRLRSQDGEARYGRFVKH